MNGNHTTVLASILLAFLLAAVSAGAGESEDFRFAERLARDGMHVAAAEEYERFAENYPSSPLRPAALFSAGESWMQAGKATEALAVLEEFLGDYPSDEDACRARYYRGTILDALKRFEEAAVELMAVSEEYSGCPLEGRALLEAGEAMIAAGAAGEAVPVLRRVARSGAWKEQAPRAAYSLASALFETGRDLEAVEVLEDLVSEHPMSPVSALAVMRLADRALEEGRYGEAASMFERAAGDYREESLRERALSRLITATVLAGEDRRALEAAERYLELFPGAAGRGSAYRAGMDAAARLQMPGKAVSMIDDWRAESGRADSTGAVSLERARLLRGMGEREKALEETARFRRTFPGSPLLPEALMLEASMLERADRDTEASVRYSLAIVEGIDGEDRLQALLGLARISAEAAGDTAAAIGYYLAAGDEDRGGAGGYAALEAAARLAEAAGDLERAARIWSRVEDLHIEGERREEAARERRRLEVLAGPGGDAVASLAGVAAGEGSRHERLLQAGIVLLEEAGRPAEAEEYVRMAIEAQPEGTDAAKARYYLGAALAGRYEISKARGERDGGSRKEAMSVWRDLARDAAGTEWARKAHRAWLEYRIEEAGTGESLERLEEFLSYYPRNEDWWWALREKFEILYREARSGSAPPDSALALAPALMSADAPQGTRKETLLRTGYLYRMKDNGAAAAQYLSAFSERYPDDPRALPVLYDLGEIRLASGEHAAALEAYERCLENEPAPDLEARCRLRAGDCMYYMKDYDGAAEEYGLIAAARGRAMGDVAALRQAMALERAGDTRRAGSILRSMYDRDDLAPGVRKNVLEMLGRRLTERSMFDEALTPLEELAAIEPSREGLIMLARTLLELERYGEAAQAFSSALEFDGADTCRVLAGRAEARFASGETESGQRDLDMLTRACPGYAGTAGALLARARAAAERRECDEASSVIDYIRDTYPSAPEASEALYYDAICDIRRGGYEEAAEKLGRFLRESPHSPLMAPAYFKLATAHYAAGNRNLAAESYALAAEAAGAEDLGFEALSNQARIYQELEEWDKAAPVWQEIAERYPGRDDIAEIFFNLGFSWVQSGRFALAHEVYSRIPSIALTEEQRGRAHYWSGICLKNLDRCGEAVREFLRVPYLRTGGMWGVTSKLEAAGCYERLGRIEEAAGIYRQIVQAHGEDSDWGSVAAEALERLEGQQQQQDRGTG